jgi:hypothetical protein
LGSGSGSSANSPSATPQRAAVSSDEAQEMAQQVAKLNADLDSAQYEIRTLYERLHEGPVGGLRLGRGRDAGVFHAGMADRLNAATFADEPDEPGHRLHRHEHPLEQPAEELGLGQVTSRELLDLGDERPDLAACPLNLHRLVDAHLDSTRPCSHSCGISHLPPHRSRS